MSDKCSHHKDKRRRFLRRFFACLLILALIILVIFLIIWAILQPKKPRFVLQDATVFAFNASVPNFLTSNFQVTVVSRNPNGKIAIYYDRLHIYATYRSQQITYYTEIPPTYQDSKDITTWSPFVYGTMVPVAPYNGLSLGQDQSNGAVWLLIKLEGRVRWRVGAFISGRYHLHVNCPAYIPFGNPNTGISVGKSVKYQLSTSCSVSV